MLYSYVAVANVFTGSLSENYILSEPSERIVYSSRIEAKIQHYQLIIFSNYSSLKDIFIVVHVDVYKYTLYKSINIFKERISYLDFLDVTNLV